MVGLCVLGASSLGANESKKSYSPIEKVDFPSLAPDVQREVARYLPNKDLLNLMLVNRESYQNFLHHKAGRIVGYDLAKAEEKDHLFNYLREAKRWGLHISLALNHATDDDVDFLADYLGIINRLYLQGKGVRYLDALGKASNLQVLKVWETRVRDVSALSTAANLKILNLYSSLSEMVTGLNQLPQLEKLSLTLKYTLLYDMEFLTSAINLKILDLSGSSIITNMQVLKNLSHLEELILKNATISDLNVIVSLSTLKTLDLSDTVVEDIRGLGDLTQVWKLILHKTQIHKPWEHISDVSALVNLTQLQMLDLSDTRVSDISALSKLIQLNWLDLSYTRVRDVSALGNLQRLKTLNLTGTGVRQVSELRSKNPTLKIIGA
jgi:Leucine-rich repeat (LRR) protein